MICACDGYDVECSILFQFSPFAGKLDRTLYGLRSRTRKEDFVEARVIDQDLGQIEGVAMVELGSSM
ncbi:hypothetical protein BIZ92_08235 [Achromobacter xylosoxidans]|uniref:Uncharacterized protein n=1 Tax=Alcaligenes xylosoxydans xylosoxydans TaxID=85698 RepID=A0A1R1JZV3_ALCXX|nr:hypothetical protein BIZ92_08235 [Achromobacter xylosoxidans]